MDDFLTIASLILLLIAAILFVISRLRTVPQGHIALVQTFGRHSKYWRPGLHFLWPFQSIEREVWIQKREMKNVLIENIFTHGGLPLGVMLSYEMGLVPELMQEDDLYKDEEERIKQQTRILQKALQDLVREAAPPPNTNPDPNRVNTLLLFSPFLGQQVAQLRDELTTRAGKELAKHGIRLSPGSLNFSRFQLPQPLIDAYTEFLSRGFTSASWHEFLTRIRNAGINLSDAAAVQLMNVMQENPGSINTIFTAGGFQPELRANFDDSLSMRMGPGQPAAPPSPQGTPPPAPGQPMGVDRSNDFPLTEEDMLLLR